MVVIGNTPLTTGRNLNFLPRTTSEKSAELFKKKQTNKNKKTKTNKNKKKLCHAIRPRKKNAILFAQHTLAILRFIRHKLVIDADVSDRVSLQTAMLMISCIVLVKNQEFVQS